MSGAATEWPPARPFWPLIFIGMMAFGLFLPHHFGRAPYSYVAIGGLVFFFVGGAVVAITGYVAYTVLGLPIPTE